MCLFAGLAYVFVHAYCLFFIVKSELVFFFVISVPISDAFACFSRFSLAWCLINFPCQLWLFWNRCVDACVLLSCRSTTLILSLMLIPMFAEIDIPMLAYFCYACRALYFLLGKKIKCIRPPSLFLIATDKHNSFLSLRATVSFNWSQCSWFIYLI